MDVTYDPEDGSDVRKWVFDPDDVLKSEAKAIEKHFGESWEAWVNALRIRNMKAREVLLWHLLHLDHPKLRFEDTPDFRVRQVVVEMSSAELMEVYQQMAKTKMNADLRDAFESAFQRDYQEALLREGKAVDGELIQNAVSVPKEAV
jgi:hypothetical protein